MKKKGDEEFHSFDDDFNVTFNKKMKANKPFSIGGRTVYPKDLETLVPVDTQTRSERDLYLVDSLLDAYFIVLLNKRATKSSVTIFPVESYIVSNIMMEGAFENALQCFIRYSVPEQDIVLLPLVRNEHITLIVIIRKLKMLLYLDSLSGVIVPKSEIDFVMSLYKSYDNIITKTNFNIFDWHLYIPKDIPKQKNGYDCGVYACLFAELLICGNKDVLKYLDFKDLCQYRHIIRSSMEKEMRDCKIKAFKERTFSKKNLLSMALTERLELKNINVESVQGNTMEFLATIVNKYWDEDTMSTCALGNECNNVFDKMVICKACDHWFHLKCLKLSEPSSFEKCPRCS